jgi:hypothetical protein
MNKYQMGETVWVRFIGKVVRIEEVEEIPGVKPPRLQYKIVADRNAAYVLENCLTPEEVELLK